MTAKSIVACPLCGHEADVVNEKHPGYAQPSEFAIAECGYCDVQFCKPMESDPVVYENIYANATTLPGYSRYEWYADQVRRHRNPLAWLQSQEAMYDFIASELSARGGPSNFQSVVELGSGLGYLTFSLHEAGYKIRGFELSQAAVDKASRRFGDLFTCGDGTRLEGVSGVDALIMTEVIEHVCDPVALLRGVRNVLRPGGIALVTTPNKSAAPKSAYWQTDNPPVHLWWFSETSMRRMAEAADLRISLPSAKQRVCRPAWPPYFDSAGRQIAPSSTIKTVLKTTPGMAFRLIALVRNHRQRTAQKQASRDLPPTMCVVLEKRD